VVVILILLILILIIFAIVTVRRRKRRRAAAVTADESDAGGAGSLDNWSIPRPRPRVWQSGTSMMSSERRRKRHQDDDDDDLELRHRYGMTYLPFALSLPVYHRPQPTRLHSALSCAAVSIFLQLNLKPAVHISFSRSLFRVFLGRPLSLATIWFVAFLSALSHEALRCIRQRLENNTFFRSRFHMCCAAQCVNWRAIPKGHYNDSRCRLRESVDECRCKDRAMFLEPTLYCFRRSLTSEFQTVGRCTARAGVIQHLDFPHYRYSIS